MKFDKCLEFMQVMLKNHFFRGSCEGGVGINPFQATAQLRLKHNNN